MEIEEYFLNNMSEINQFTCYRYINREIERCIMENKRIKDLFDIYLGLKRLFRKEIDNDIFTEEKSIEQIDENNFEIGNLFICSTDDFMFLLVSEDEDFYYGYKVCGWCNFATQTDFKFKFEDEDWIALTSTELAIEKENNCLIHLGKIDEEHINILFDYVVNDVEIPKEFLGEEIDLTDLTDYRNIFRMIELMEVKKYIFNQFV